MDRPTGWKVGLRAVLRFAPEGVLGHLMGCFPMQTPAEMDDGRYGIL
jgi:hypothetical protein